MKNYHDVLVSLGACQDACDARKNMTVEAAMLQAKRGDWLLWLAWRLGISRRKITLAKARCARTVIHLMNDGRSRNAVEVAERFGNNAATCDELATAATYAAAAATYATTAAAATYAAAAAADAAAAAATYADAYAAATYAADAAAAAAADAATYADAYAARKKNQEQTARICVEALGADIIAAVNLLIKGELAR